MNTKTPTQTSTLAQIAEIERLSLAELRERWKMLNGSDPPAYSREHLVRRLCYRLQELQFGGLPGATRAALRAVAEREAPGGQVRPLVRRDANVGGPVPGTVYVREWRGKRYEVRVADGGFELEGRLYKSLSAVAKAITGQHWNGPLFFGLTSRRKNG